MNGTKLRPDDTTYSTPYLGVIKGQAMMIFGSGDGSVWAFQPRTGKRIWSFRFSLRGLNVSPLVDGETIYMGQSEENRDDSTMGALGAYNANGVDDITQSNELWRVKELMIGKSSPVLVDGRLYALDDSNIAFCHRLEDRQGNRQASAPRGNDHTREPRLCRRQDPGLHHQRLACRHARGRWHKDYRAAALPERRGNLRLAGCVARPDLRAVDLVHVLRGECRR